MISSLLVYLTKLHKMENKINIHGHRGARGLFPENTITSFIEAIKLGVEGVEFDVVISKDNKVVVSHEAWMNDLFCSKPNGDAIKKEEAESYNLYRMNYDEIKKFDCGIRGNELFPSQKKIAEHKPLLSEVITAINSYIKLHKLQPITFNIEIKTEEDKGTLFNPEPIVFVDLVYKELQKLNALNRCILQSFDVRILQALKQKDNSLVLSLLVENKLSLEENLHKLGFKPTYYTPEYILITEKLITDLKKLKIQLMTWTVNEASDLEKLIIMGVTTIITDYPDKAINFVKNKS